MGTSAFARTIVRDALRIVGLLACAIIALGLRQQQNTPDPAKLQIELGVPGVYLTQSSATGASSAQVTLTIPAPQPNNFVYVCKLEISASNDGVGAGALTNATWTSTNFNSWAWKYSSPMAARTNYEHAFDWGQPASGCAKAILPGTAVTFVSTAATGNDQFTMSAVWFYGK
jgi:hypothetical protein